MASVVVVDDIADNVRRLRDLLEDEGHTVIGCRSGAEALEIVAEQKPDVVLLDVLMPEMDGFEVCRRIKSNPELSQIPVIMASALNAEEDIVSGLDAGANDFITRPISGPLVSARVRSALRVKEAHDRQLQLTRSLDDACAKLGRTVSELERSKADLDQFAFVASHDLQEPLRTIASFVQLLERKYASQLDDTAREYIEYAVDGSRRMSRMLKDLLEYSRIGAEPIVHEPVDLDSAVAVARQNLQTAIECCDAQVSIDDLPRIMGNHTQLVRLFQNLVSNGVKYRGGERRPEVQIYARARGNAWRIFVADNGIGIPSEAAERVFQVFQRLHSEGDYSGTGIGLAIANRIVEAHRGQIWLESSSKDGSTFCIEFPALDSEANA